MDPREAGARRPAPGGCGCDPGADCPGDPQPPDRGATELQVVFVEDVPPPAVPSARVRLVSLELSDLLDDASTRPNPVVRQPAPARAPAPAPADGEQAGPRRPRHRAAGAPDPRPAPIGQDR